MTIAPSVPHTDVSMNGRIPYFGSEAVDAHSVPKKKSVMPISLIARNAADYEKARNQNHKSDGQKSAECKYRLHCSFQIYLPLLSFYSWCRLLIA